jgi:hypothetical protein
MALHPRVSPYSILVLRNISLLPAMLTYQVPGQHASHPLSPQYVIPRKICTNVSLAVTLTVAVRMIIIVFITAFVTSSIVTTDLT